MVLDGFSFLAPFLAFTLTRLRFTPGLTRRCNHCEYSLLFLIGLALSISLFHLAPLPILLYHHPLRPLHLDNASL